MQDLVNKLFLFLSGSYLIWCFGVNAASVFAFTLSLTLSCLCTYFANQKICGFIIVLFCLISLLEPHFAPYLPLFFYDILHAQKRFLLFAGLLSAICAVFQLPAVLLCPFIILKVMSFLLARYSGTNKTLLQELHFIRDQSTEAEIHLKERNQALIQKQNMEIQAATLSERNRIAREIHDNVGHLLTRSLLQTGALKVINTNPSLEESLNTLNDTLNTAMTNIRTSVHDLHDESINLHRILQEIVSRDPSLTIQLEYDVEHELPREMKYAFISIVREAINNIHKHSNADRAKIVVREHPGFFLLQIQDNGTIENELSETDGIGLSGIRERIQALGGTLRIDTRHGFLINISIAKSSYTAH